MLAVQYQIPTCQEEQAPHEVHGPFHLTPPRVDNNNYCRIVAATQNLPPFPLSASYNCTNHNRQQLFDRNMHTRPTTWKNHSPDVRYAPNPQEPDASDVSTTCRFHFTILLIMPLPFQTGRKHAHYCRYNLNLWFSLTLWWSTCTPLARSIILLKNDLSGLPTQPACWS